VSLPPFQRHSDTSLEAAISKKPNVGTEKGRVLEFLRTRGPSTDEEIQDGLRMLANTERPRRRELQLEQFGADSGFRRTTRSGRKAVVWKAMVFEPEQEELPY